LRSGIDLAVLKQGIDTITPAGRFTFHVLGAMDEMFADLISGGTRERLATSTVPTASRPRHQAALPDQRYRPSSQRAMLR